MTGMTMRDAWRVPALIAVLASTAMTPAPYAFAQQAAAPAAAPAEGQKLSDAQIDQLTAPIALYPDALVAQILMAATYPLEIVQAARWAKANPKVTGKALEDAMQQQPWDPAVKSLTAVPQVLQMMNEKLDWTQQIGDAVLAQEADVLKSVQRLRAKAQQAGSLKSTEQQKVTTEQAGATTVIKIEPADPQVIYVPSYTPTAVYGPWPYPAYPPYSYYPPGYVAGTALLSFGIGMAAGAAIWGNCNWGGGGDANININNSNYNNFNRTNISGDNKFQHNVDHRKGVAYNNPRVNDQFRGGRSDAASRDQYRGRDGGAGAGNRGGAGAGTRDVGGGQRPGAGASAGTRDLGGGQRSGASASTRQASAFEGMNRSGSDARAQSARGSQSRATMSSQGGGRASASAGGGGGGRASAGGGGGRSGGGGGGRR